MDQPSERQGIVEEREQSARHALHDYRERRRRRRGEDTYFGSLDCLLPIGGEAEGAPSAEHERRRSEIIDDAEAAGMSLDLAERLYVVAQEEGLDPGLAYELVRCGLGVAPPAEGVSNAPVEPVADKYFPEWLLPPSAPDDRLRERMLRVSFRRLRSLLEAHEEVEDAFRAFAREPDVGNFGY